MQTTIEPFLILVLLLSVKHFLADFPLQTKKMIQEKGQYLKPAGVVHSSIHGAGTAIALLAAKVVLVPISLPLVVFLAFLDAVIHYHIDWTKKQFTDNLNTDNPEFWWAIGFDQLLHSITYLAIVWMIFR